MIYAEKGFKIKLSKTTLEFSGKLEKSDYTEIDAFLQQVDQELSSETCTVKLDTLEYLNSSGIRAIATFIIESSKSFEIVINPEITWQATNIPVLETLKPDTITIVPC